MSNQSNIQRFESLLMECNREGIDSLLNYIRKTDFYTAPASTRYHSCHEGGLLEHSLNVYDCLMAKLNDPVWKPILEKVGKDSIAITALLHDICKANFYIVEYRNKKIYSEYGKKVDSQGRYDWESVPSYTIEDQFPLGHGEKSVMIANGFIDLKANELYAIRWHMGFTEASSNYNTLSAAIRKYPFILAVHEADLEATYLLEKEE